MTAIQISSNSFVTSGGFASMVQDLWDGKISEIEFIKDSHQQGVSAARIEWEIEQLKLADEVL